MSNQFFDNGDLSKTCYARRYSDKEDDTDYDALNNETFGDNNAGFCWEEHHEQFMAISKDMERKKTLDEETTELSLRVASYILEDEADDSVTENSLGTAPTHAVYDQSLWPTNDKGAKEVNGKVERDLASPIWNVNNNFTSNTKAAATLPSQHKMLTLDEIEKGMIQEAERKPILPQKEIGRDPVPNENIGAEHQSHSTTPKARTALMNGQLNAHYQPEGQGNRPHRNNQLERFPRPNGPAEGYRSRPPLNHMHRPPFGERIPMPPYLDPRFNGHNFSDFQRRIKPIGIPTYPRAQRPVNKWIFPHQIQHSGLIPQRRPVMGSEQHRPPFLPVQQGAIRHPFSGRHHHLFDEYAGLMSHSEMEFLANIQMTQINSNQQYPDGYYYMMYQHRQQGNAGRKYMYNRNNREMAPKAKPIYTPQQFENSLGKLQIGSVTAPRKMIDFENKDLVEHKEKENFTKHTERKSKQVLIEIEELINMALHMEEVHRCDPLPRLDIDFDDVQKRVTSILQSKGKLGAVMAVRKGKRAVLRLLPYLTNSALYIGKILEELVPISKKDQEQLLLSFLPPIRNFLETASMDTIINFTKLYETEFLLSNKFMVSVMANMVSRVGCIMKDGIGKDTALIDEWKLFLLRLVKGSLQCPQTERPVVAVDNTMLSNQMQLIYGKETKSNILKLKNLLSNTYTAPTAIATSQPLDQKNVLQDTSH